MNHIILISSITLATLLPMSVGAGFLWGWLNGYEHGRGVSLAMRAHGWPPERLYRSARHPVMTAAAE